MTIFFSAASDVDKKTLDLYLQTMDLLREGRNSVIDCLFNKVTEDKPKATDDFNKIYNGVIKKIDEADILVADISTPSGGVGYQVYHAIYQRKPVILIYKEGSTSNPSTIMRGIKSKRVIVMSYKTIEDLQKMMPGCLMKVQGMVKVRFNLVMTSCDYAFIESESRKVRSTKTKYLLKMIRLAKKKPDM